MKHTITSLAIGALTAVVCAITAAPAFAGTPSAPQTVTASPATAQAQVSWTAPSSDGGTTITGYTITPYAGATPGTPVSASASASSADVTGLTNGTAYTFQVTATNASGTSPPGTSSAVTPEDTIFDFSGQPTQIDSGDTSAVNLGVTFTADSNGSVTGIRFYKSPANTGTHVGSLWSASGTLLASGTFTDETASGWQTLIFSSPVAITAGTEYVASYLAPNGHYSDSVQGLNASVDNPPLHAVANTTSPDGLYAYGAANTFPTNSYNATNYWVDVLFAPSAGGGGTSAPLAPVAANASPASGQALVSWVTPSNGGSAITGYTVTPYAGSTAGTPVAVNGSATSADVTGLTDGTAYTFTVTATNAIGTSPASTTGAVTPQDTIFDFSATPAQVDSGDSSAVNLGVNFTATSNGMVTGIRFYKASTNTGTHIGSLWTAGGTELASGTFTDESASGWQTLVFTNPVAITAGTTYVASYYAPNGHYSATPAGLNAAVTNGPLETVAAGVTANGVYAYGPAGTFPASSYNATNYWVDVLFSPGSGGGGPATAPSSPSGVSASPASGQALVSWVTPSNGGSPITSYTVTPYIGSTAGTPIHVSNGSATSVDMTGLTNGTAYTFTVTATNSVGTSAASAASSAATPEDTIFDFSGTPAQVDSGDGSPVNVGVEFTANTSGSVTGVRFYKATANTGTHVGALWTAGGSLLASGTFANETATGWQTLTFSSPVGIVAGTTYVASYYAPNGHYSATPSGFNAAVVNGPLTAPANATTANGVYAYGGANTFPGSSYNATNYWVDVLFAPGSGGAATAPSAPASVTASPASGQALVSWSTPNSGGSAITSYTITPYIGSTAQTPVQVNSGAATSATVTGLSDGTAYTFTVTATNAVGASPASSPSSATTPEDTLFDFSSTPAQVDSGDTGAVNLGVAFTAATTGSVTGIRFYKAATNTGTHVGALWTSGGTLLESGTFTNETTSGWQTLVFASPVAITAGTTYVASYYAPNGHYSATPAGLSAGASNPPLSAVANATSADGLYAYGAANTFPTGSYNATNYWVDVLFAPSTSTAAPGQATNVAASALPQAASVSWSAPTSGGPVSSYTIQPYDGTTAVTPLTVSGANTSATVLGLIPDEDYTFVVTPSNATGTGPASAASNDIDPAPATAPSAPTNVVASPGTTQALVSWQAPSNNGGSTITGYTVTPYIGSTAQPTTQINSGTATSADITGLNLETSYTFTVTATTSAGTSPESSPSAPVTPEFTLFDFSGTPSIIDSGDAEGIVVGVDFTADSGGSVTGIRFYKAAANTGTHIGSLWTSTGTLLASGTFTNETASGWQTLVFSSPVTLTSGATYVASYFAPHGHYSATPQGLANAVNNPPLHSVPNATAADGVYSYSSTNVFPVNSYNATNYWVDLLFAPSSTNSAPGEPSGVTAVPGYGNATITWSAPWNGGSPITSYTITPYIGATAQTATTITGTPPVTTATASGLTNGSDYTFEVSATNANGTGPGSSPSAAVTPGPQPGGEWSSLTNWPLVAIHATLMSTGNILTWDGWQQPQPTQEFDPATGTFSNPINSPDGIFCAAMVNMPDGDVLAVGGYGELSTGNLGIVDTNIYDPTTGTWTRMADMHYPRWYPGLSELADGDYVVISGKTTDFDSWADTPEVYDPTANTWTLLNNVDTSEIHELEYPNTYELPNGNVLVLGEQEDLSYELNVANQTWTQVGGKSGVVNGASVMYRPGKILYAGGAASLATPATAQSNAAVLDTTSSDPQWTSVAPMAYPRAFQTLQMLADGTVLAIGGEPQTGVANGEGEVSNGVLPSEIWNPTTQTWTTVASMAATRGYHTSTLLLPDGRVLVAGSGHAAPGLPGQYTAQYYSPPYLFNGPRPTISSIPSTATNDSSITVDTPDASSITAVNLVDLGASTHQMDWDQHFVPLSFTAGDGTLSVQMPSATDAPPGNYMLFFINSNGVPSIAPIINLSAGGDGSDAVDAAMVPARVTAAALADDTAQVTWTAPAVGAGEVKSYTVTPSTGGHVQRPVTVSGSPVPTSAIVHGLRPGSSYTFTVVANSGRGPGRSSRPSRTIVTRSKVRPAFVQETSAYSDTTQRLVLTGRSALVPGDRLVVEVSTWGRGARAAGVTDSAGDRYTEVVSREAPDGTELSVWTAAITGAGGAAPTITVTPDSTADVGAVAAEYSGLSLAAGARAVEAITVADGTTRRAAVVASGATRATTTGTSLAVGLYADSGFGDIVKPSRLYAKRADISRTSTMMEELVEDRVVSRGARPDAAALTGARTPWLMATVVFRPAGSSGSPVTAIESASAIRRITAAAARTATTTAAAQAKGTTASSATTRSNRSSTPAAVAGSGAATTAAATTLTTETTSPTLTTATSSPLSAAGSERGADERASTTTVTGTRVLTSLDLVPPLSSRSRPHPVAGAISEYLGLTDGFLPLYYCLVRAADR